MEIFPKDNTYHLSLSIVKKAQQTLLSPQDFYNLCQQLKKININKNIYFIPPNLLKFQKNPVYLDYKYFFLFFDYLSEQIKLGNQKKYFYLQKVLIKFKNHIFFTLRLKKTRQQYFKISVEIIGEGMIGRVAKVRINEGEDLAFKVFFDSSLVWQHGPWAEIPVSLYLQAHNVTKNIPEFKFASENWAVWEWIYPETKPDSRPGITYEEFAAQEGLTPLNYLNSNNYNPHQIRLDLGGIQKEYAARRWDDFWKSIIFYWRKIRREGFSFLTKYLTWDSIYHFTLRLIILIFSNPVKPKPQKDLGVNELF